MALLDFYSNPQTMGLLGMAGGLLQASGPSPYPRGLGSALGTGLLQGAQMAQGTAQQNLQQTYLGEQLKQLQAANAKQAQLAPIMAQVASRFGAPQQPMQQNPMVPGQPGSSVMAGSGSTTPVASSASNPAGGFPFTLEDVTLLKMIGGPDLTSAFTASRPNLAVEGGLLIDRHRGVQGTVPQMNQQGFSTQLQPDGRGGFTVGVTPGAAEAYRLQQDIGEQSRASRDPFMGVMDSQGRPIPMTREGFARTYGGAGTSGQPRGVGQTPAEKASATTMAEGDAKRVQDLEAKIPNLLSVSRRLDRMSELTKDDATYAAAGAELKTTLGSIVQATGLKVNEKKTANSEEYIAHVAELLKDRLASKDYGSGTGVSNLDILAAQKPLPEFAKTAAGRMQLIQALKADTERNLRDAQAARDYFDTNSGLRGFRFPSELDAEKQKRVRDLPKEPGTFPGALPAGVTVRRVR